MLNIFKYYAIIQLGFLLAEYTINCSERIVYIYEIRNSRFAKRWKKHIV